MDWTDVPADSELRRLENIFFPEDIRETTNTVFLAGEPLTKLSLLIVKFRKGLEWIRKFSHQQRPIFPRMPS